MDSEGLLLLTDDGRLAHRIAHPRHNQPKTYLAQVEGVVDENALQQLREGLLLNDGKTRPAQARAADEPDWLWPDRKSTRLNSSHVAISYAVFCLKKKTKQISSY